MNNTARPENLLYAFDEKASGWTLLILACQYMVSVMGASLIFPVILIQEAHTTPLISASIISVVILVIAVVTFLQAQRFWLLGSGTFLPLSASPNYLAQSMLAVSIGGVPLLFGMTMLAGIFQGIFSLVIDSIRKYFPSEIAALIIILIGIELAMLGIKEYADYQNLQDTLYVSKSFLFYCIEFLPLALIIIFERWGKGFLKLYGLVVAVVIGYLLIYFIGFMDPGSLQNIHAAKWLFFPTLASGGWHFNITLLIPFAIGALVGTIKICGALAALQELQDVRRDVPDVNQIARANFTDAMGSFFSGLLGGMGLNASSSGIALSLATGVTTKYIAYPFSFILIALAFCPKISLVFVYMPQPLIAAVLLALGATLFISGLKMLLRHIKTFKQQLTIGISLALGLSHSVYPDIYLQLPGYIQMLTGSSLALATVVAVILNFIFSMI